MRISLFLFAFTFAIAAHAQTHFPVAGANYTQPGVFNHYSILNDSNALSKKWSVTGYGGLAAGIGFFNGGNSAFFPVQAGVQVNRRLSNNLYAFAGATLTPVFFNFNRSFSTADPHGSYMTAPGFNANRFGVYQGIQAGLMYVNDAKTFSISGSISVSNSSSPFYPANSINNQKQRAFTGTRQ